MAHCEEIGRSPGMPCELNLTGAKQLGAPIPTSRSLPVFRLFLFFDETSNGAEVFSFICSGFTL